jgi:hypothetical protein
MTHKVKIPPTIIRGIRGNTKRLANKVRILVDPIKKIRMGKTPKVAQQVGSIYDLNI